MSDFWVLLDSPQALLPLIAMLLASIYFLISQIQGRKSREKLEQWAKKWEISLSSILNLRRNNPVRVSVEEGLKLMDEYKWDAAIEIFRKVLAGAKNEKHKVVALNLIGLCFYKQSDLDPALGNYKESLELAKKIKDKEGEAANLGNIGLVYYDKGELDKALEYHNKALKIDKEIGNKEGEAANLGNIGLVYYDKGELDKALDNYNQSLKINEELGSKEGIANQLGNIGLVYYIKGELDKALEYYNRALKIFTEIGMTMEIERAKQNIAEVKSKQ
jgi:tetratricopeptide (TPR) repeat protein